MPDLSIEYVTADGSEHGDDTVSSDEPVVGLQISDRCRPLIQEFYGYKAEHVGTPGADDHCLDALRYALMGIASR